MFMLVPGSGSSLSGLTRSCRVGSRNHASQCRHLCRSNHVGNFQRVAEGSRTLTSCFTERCAYRVHHGHQKTGPVPGARDPNSVDKRHVPHGHRLRFGVHQHLVPAAQGDRLVIGMANLAAVLRRRNRADDYRRSFPTRGLEVESHQTSSVRPHQPKLARRSPADAGHPAGLPPQHHHNRGSRRVRGRALARQRPANFSVPIFVSAACSPWGR